MPKTADKFHCEKCDFACCKQSNWDAHILTRKHNNRINLNENMPENATPLFVCKNCSKVYKARNSLWYHENKCKNEPTKRDTPPPDESIYMIVNKLISENQDLKKFIIDQASEHKKDTLDQVAEYKKETLDLITQTLVSYKPTVIQTTNNTQNNKFNINVFLNETCKNAMNFSDFVKNIQITYEDLENNAQLGFVNGISKIFLDNLKQLDISERPIHCTDVKRETMYIRDDNTWKKHTDDQILQKAIQAVSYKSMGKLAEWKQANPDYKDADSEFSQRCLTIQKHTLAGSERGVYYPKVTMH